MSYDKIKEAVERVNFARLQAEHLEKEVLLSLNETLENLKRITKVFSKTSDK